MSQLVVCLLGGLYGWLEIATKAFVFKCNKLFFDGIIRKDISRIPPEAHVCEKAPSLGKSRMAGWPVAEFLREDVDRRYQAIL